MVPQAFNGDDLCLAGLAHLHALGQDTDQQMLNRQRDERMGDRQGRVSSSVSPNPSMAPGTRVAQRLNCQAHLPDLSRFQVEMDKDEY